MCICGGNIGELKILKVFPVVETFICGGGIGKLTLSDPFSKIILPLCKGWIEGEIVFDTNVTIKEGKVVYCKKAIIKEAPNIFLPHIQCEYLQLPIEYNGDAKLLKECRYLVNVEGTDKYKEKVMTYILSNHINNLEVELMSSPFAKNIEERFKCGECCYCGGRKFKFDISYFALICAKCEKKKILPKYYYQSKINKYSVRY